MRRFAIRASSGGHVLTLCLQWNTTMTIGLLVGALCLTLNVVCISLVCPRSVQLSTVIGFNYQRALLWMGRHKANSTINVCSIIYIMQVFSFRFLHCMWKCFCLFSEEWYCRFTTRFCINGSTILSNTAACFWWTADILL